MGQLAKPDDLKVDEKPKRPDDDAKPKAQHRTPYADEGGLGTAMALVRRIEHVWAVHAGRIPDKERRALRQAFLQLSPLDKLTVRVKLGAKLDQALGTW